MSFPTKDYFDILFPYFKSRSPYKRSVCNLRNVCEPLKDAHEALIKVVGLPKYRTMICITAIHLYEDGISEFGYEYFREKCFNLKVGTTFHNHHFEQEFNSMVHIGFFDLTPRKSLSESKMYRLDENIRKELDAINARGKVNSLGRSPIPMSNFFK